jgi:hypothetical protein
MAAEGGGWWTQLPTRFYMLRTDSRIMRYAALFIGVIAMVKVFSLVWWK